MKHTLKRHKATLFALSLLAFAVVAGFTVTQFRTATVVRADASDNFTGFAWSDMPDGSDQQINPTGLTVGRGAGWISFNSTDIASSVDYGVNVDSAGHISGNAWSEHMGWISFDITGGCPGTAPCAPTINLATGLFSGWARALAGGTPQSGGWDGWIALANNGTGGPAYGVTVNTTTGDVSGYAWGGDVLGWINFSGVHITLPPLLPSLTLVANPTSIAACSGNPLETDLTYASPAGLAFTNCTFTSSPSGSDVHGDTAPADHPLPTVANQTIGGVSVLSPNTTFTLTCTGTGVPTSTASASVSVSTCTPSATISGPSCYQTAPASATLSWNSSNVTSCSINNGVGTVSPSGSTSVTVTGTTTYTITCTGSYGSATSSHTISINPSCTNPGGGSGGTPNPIFQET